VLDDLDDFASGVKPEGKPLRICKPLARLLAEAIRKRSVLSFLVLSSNCGIQNHSNHNLTAIISYIIQKIILCDQNRKI
jgi:hypothetical protein